MSNNGFENKDTGEIVCPYCGHEFHDSWEYESGETTCHSCEREFEVEVNHSVTYSTSKMNCEKDHVFEYETEFVKERDWKNSAWVPLEKKDHKLIKKYSCTNCEETEYKYFDINTGEELLTTNP